MSFICYELGLKAYICFDQVNFKFIISRDVIFEEGEKWTWSKQDEDSNSFTFLPNFLPDESMEEDFECADDEVEVTAPHEEFFSSPCDFEDNQLLEIQIIS